MVAGSRGALILFFVHKPLSRSFRAHANLGGLFPYPWAQEQTNQPSRRAVRPPILALRCPVRRWDDVLGVSALRGVLADVRVHGERIQCRAA